MKYFRFILLSFTLSAISAVLFSFFVEAKLSSEKFPYRQAGLTEREAAAHLLSRFTYGAKAHDVDMLVEMGLEKWFQHQLNADLPDDTLDRRLSVYDAIHLSNTEVCAIYPKGASVIAMAIKDSVISKDSLGKAFNQKAFDDKVQMYMQKKGFKSEKDFYNQFIDQNLVRAIYTNNQLQEVLTDFWFNHFNVSFTKGESAQFIPAYERDIIRPHVFGKFDQLLIATAKSPAMLYFLDNFTSVGPAVATAKKNLPEATTVSENGMMGVSMSTSTFSVVKNDISKKSIAGLNENYAREVMELHTLGVDGGYTQTDVTEAARVLTGWTIYPIASSGSASSMKNLVEKIGTDSLERKGFIREGDFLFTPNRHDKGEKTVLGHHFEAKGGYQEGIELLELLAHHLSTARFISKKLAVRFICDSPPSTLLDKMAQSFLAHDGDIREVLITMVSAVEFWDKKFIGAKIKSPFELAVSASRAINADVLDPFPLYNWIAKMGQKPYYYQAPTGFPDRAQYWVNTGTLLNRINFSTALAFQQIKGTVVDLNKLPAGRPPESARKALEIYCKLLLPERDQETILRQLSPLLADPAMAIKMQPTLSKTPEQLLEKPTEGALGDMMTMGVGNDAPGHKATNVAQQPAKLIPVINNPVLCEVLALVIGSPEFQRR